MKSFSISICFLFSIRCSFSSLINSDSKDLSQWLPKCCPEGKVISSDGKSCIQDTFSTLINNATDNEDVLPSDVLSVLIVNQTVQYKLLHKSQFNCVRHELYVVNNDIFVTADNDVVVYDDYGKNWTLSTSELCVDSVVFAAGPGLRPTRLFIALLCPSCQGVVCLHKCCPESDRLQVSEDTTKVDCVPSSGTSWSQQSQEDTSKRTFVFHGFPECPRSLYLDYPSGPVRVGPHANFLLRNGVSIPRAEYCGDYTGTEGSGGYAILACRQTLPPIKPAFYGALLCVGAAFLALTLGLHLWLPELRTSLHSRVLLAHVSCLLAAFLGLALVDLAPLPTPSLACSASAFFIQFSILAAIFWLNVMCIDIAWTFSGVRAPRASLTLDSDGHKYLYYSLYAWSSTVAISGLTAVLEYGSFLPRSSRLKPAFGVTACWFRYWESILLLVYGPIGILLLTNVALFVYTAIKIRRTHRDTATMVQHAGSKLREDRDRFSLYLKLFCLMGVTWMFDVVSWVVGGSDSYWYITDAINALRGVFIFSLFCLKKNVITLVKDKMKLILGILLLVSSVTPHTPDKEDEIQLPSIPTLIEQLALREEKVMKQLTTQMLPPVGYVVNKPSPDPDRGDRPFNRPSSYEPEVLNKPLNRPPVSPSASKEVVTETDLYLLGAIERLVYRVDLMEKRMRRTEELLYHVMEGSNIKREDPCPANFTRVARNCYHLSDRPYNWKSASSMCKSLGANLLELESREEYSEIVTYLQSDPYLRGMEFWTGGLNPGLLWIWSNSGRPVLPKRPTTRPEDTVLGAGRCLKLSYSSTASLYQYRGAECSIPQRYICEHEENTTVRALNRLHKALKL